MAPCPPPRPPPSRSTSRPGVRSRSCGLRVLPGVKQANSVVTVLPSRTAPAARSRVTIAASWSGRRPAWMMLPCSVGKSAVSTMSLTATGTPCSGPSAPACALALVECARLGAGMLGIEMGEGLDAGLVRRDPGEAGLGHGECRDLAGGDVRRDLDGRGLSHRAPTAATARCPGTGRAGPSRGTPSS